MLANNAQEMKTVVETYIIEETASLIYDNETLDKWNDRVKELGLEGQTQIVKPTKSPIPFMHMKGSLVEVFRTLCPRRVMVDKYNLTPIPLEILDLVALSTKEKYFDQIEIWYDEAAPDPACIGSNFTNYYVTVGKHTEQSGLTKEAADKLADELGGTVGKYDWYRENYLLGKWADVKQSFEELTERATKRFIAEEGNAFRKKIKEAQRGLDDLEVAAFEKFNGKGTGSIF